MTSSVDQKKRNLVNYYEHSMNISASGGVRIPLMIYGSKTPDRPLRNNLLAELTSIEKSLHTVKAIKSLFAASAYAKSIRIRMLY